MDFDSWCAQLKRVAVEGYFFSPEAAARLTPNSRPSWRSYYEEGYGPQAALEVDLDNEVTA